VGVLCGVERKFLSAGKRSATRQVMSNRFCLILIFRSWSMPSGGGKNIQRIRNLGNLSI
jgi:hypothetical protein